MLEKDRDYYFGVGLDLKLAEMHAAGKHHLCICPHGPLHFFPFHLLGAEDQPMADQWCITYLPNLRLVDSAGRPVAASCKPKRDLVSIGINFRPDNTHGMPVMDEPEAEARAIADLYGVAPLLGTTATKRAVLQAITDTRRIHIATHGRLVVTAPSFQGLYVWPDEISSGVIYAYELLRLNLRGVDVVTLSACETAIGRFDIADNLRGIPAALLMAGVSTVVGTLWPVETRACTRFFELFYRHLQQAQRKHEAFYAAQKQTRAEFPKYRDWGAFYLAGDWR
jgi:CHAT domain-containing protein